MHHDLAEQKPLVGVELLEAPGVLDQLRLEYREGVWPARLSAGSQPTSEFRDGHVEVVQLDVQPELGRQLVVRGIVERVTPAEAATVYAQRSRYLQLLAWLNTRENAQLDASARQHLWAEFDAAHPTLDPPARWTGFRLRPLTLTFWRGDPIGQSTRQHYTLADGRWSGRILAG